MIKPHQLQHQTQHNTNQTLLFHQRPFVHRSASLPLWSWKQVQNQKQVKRLLQLVPPNVQSNSTSSATTATDTAEIKTTTENGTAVKLKAVVKVKITSSGFFSSLRLDQRIDDLTDLLGKSILLELVSSELDPGKLIYMYLNFYFFSIYKM